MKRPDSVSLGQVRKRQTGGGSGHRSKSTEDGGCWEVLTEEKVPQPS